MTRSKAYLFGGVEIRWNCAPELLKGVDDVPAEATFHFPGGLKDYLAAAIHADTLVHPDIFSGKSGRNGAHGACEWAVAWTADADGFLSSYCNTVPTPDGGTHESGMRSAMLAHLWDPAAGAFVVNTDDPTRNHTQDAQVESVLGGITTPAQSRQALGFIDSRLMTPAGVAIGQFDDDPYMGRYISPFISSTELLARLSVGDTNSALNLIRRTWGQMLAKGPGTVWESMRLDGLPKSGGISLAHGWAGGPVPALSGYVLGIRPTAPGYRHWIVAPQPGDLRFAQGNAPTPHGPISSRWRRHGGTFKLTIEAPRGTSGVVAVPVLRHLHRISVYGKVVHAKRRRGVVRLKTGGGQHTFVTG
jgi:hypothetical protein